MVGLLNLPRLLRHYLQDGFLAGLHVDTIAEGRRGLELAALGLDLHCSFDFLAEADTVKLIEPLYDSLDQGCKGAAGKGLGYRDYINTALLAQQGLIDDALLLVPGETRKLP